MIVYNLKQFLNSELPSEKVYVGPLRGEIPDRTIQLIPSGGVPQAWYQYVTESIQIMVRDIDGPSTFKLAKDVYNILNNRFGLILPANTVGTVVYPEIQTAQISANQLPGYIGDDDNGRAMYSTNYRIIF